MTLNMLIGILEQGLIYGIMAMRLLITYRMLAMFKKDRKVKR